MHLCNHTKHRKFSYFFVKLHFVSKFPHDLTLSPMLYFFESFIQSIVNIWSFLNEYHSTWYKLSTGNWRGFIGWQHILGLLIDLLEMIAFLGCIWQVSHSLCKIGSHTFDQSNFLLFTFHFIQLHLRYLPLNIWVVPLDIT